jgi:hypothetical protein
MQTNEQNLIRRIADYERLSCIFWIVLGVIQICLVWTAIAGIWNIIASISRWKLPDRIRRRDPTIPQDYKGIKQLVIIGIVNLLLGGFIGVLFVAFDFYIRDKVLTNAHLFTGVVQTSGDASSPPVIPVPVQATATSNSFDQQLRTLAKLRDDGVISEEDFGKKKKEVLGL